jgi:transcriptional regulator GlxA family with amidase domain
MSITSQAISFTDSCIRGRIRRAGATLRLQVVPGRPQSKSGRSRHATALMMRGGLAPRQIAAVTTYLEANIGCSIQTPDLAQLIGLNPSRFCRAFKQSVGISPHAYLMRRRVARAQQLMLATCASLAQIAADCGLTDQAHFTRLFRRFVGESPGAWRRTRAPAPPP